MRTNQNLALAEIVLSLGVIGHFCPRMLHKSCLHFLHYFLLLFYLLELE